jgi:peptide/nickel transport system substrate-binding protein
LLLAGGLAGCASILPLSVLAQGRDHATLAMVAEPPTLDPMASTADLVGTIMQHVYEPLYTFDAKWAVVPMLAEAAPKVSADGKLYTIALRKGVMLHSGRELNADDVVASLQRWLEQSPRQGVGKEVEHIQAKGAHTVEIALKSPYAPLLSQLALPTGMAAIMAKESIATPLKDFVGTGPTASRSAAPTNTCCWSALTNTARARKRPAATAASARR